MALSEWSQLERLIKEAVAASCVELVADLERRIAVRLHQSANFGPSIVVNMAQEISREVGGFIAETVMASGVAEEKLRKLL